VRIRRRLSVIAPLAFLVAALAAPAPVAAVVTTNLAGRPIGGSAATSCHGLAYGKVDNKMVLFTAYHCRKDVPGGVVVNGPGGVRIGVWGPDYTALRAHDVAYIKLDNSNWPTVKNRVYRGDVPGDNYWTITENPTFGNSCQGASWNAISSVVYQNWQSSTTSTTDYQVGVTLGYDQNNGSSCSIWTSVPWHGLGWKDSGSPFVLDNHPHQVWAVGSAHGGNNLIVTPIYGGILALDQIWANQGTHTGAWFCTTSSC
jgi:hypothetical protein